MKPFHILFKNCFFSFLIATTFGLFFSAQNANAVVDPCSPLLGINHCTGIDCSFKYAVQDTITLPAVTQLPAIFDLNDSQLVPADACIPAGTKFSITGFSTQGYQYDYQAINVVPTTLNQILRPAEVLRSHNIESVTVHNPHSNENSSSSNYSHGYHQSSSGAGRKPTSDKTNSNSSGVTFLLGATHSVSGFVADKIDPIPLVNQQRAISGAGVGLTIPIVRWMSSSAAHCNVQLVDSPQDKVGANETLITYSSTNPAGSCDSVKSTSTCFAAVAPYFNSRPDIVGGPRPGFLATGSASVVPKQFSKCSSGCDTGSSTFGWLKTSESRDFYKKNAFDCSKEKLSRTCQNGSLNPMSSDYTASFDQCVSSCKAGGAEVSLPSGVASGSKCQLPLPDAAVSTITATDVCCSGIAERVCNSLDGSETISYRCLGGSPPAPDCSGGIISWTDSQTGKTCQGIRPTTPSGRSTGLISSTTSGLNGTSSFACNSAGSWEQTGNATCGSTAPTCSGSFKWKLTCVNGDCTNHSLANNMAAITTSGNFAKCLYSGGAASTSTLDNSACDANQANSLALCKIIGVSTQSPWGGGAVTGHKCECDGTTTEQPKLCWQNTLVSPNSAISEWDCSMHYDKGGTCTTLNDKKPIGKCYNKISKKMEMPPSSYLYCMQEEPGECWNPSDAKCVPRPTTVSQTTNISSLFKLPQYGTANNNGTLRTQCEQACPFDEAHSGCVSGCYMSYPDPMIMSQEPSNVSYESGHHGGGGGGPFSLSCPDGKYVTQILGRSGAYMDSIQLKCSDLTFTSRTGGGGGGDHSISCASNQFLVGVRGRSGNYIDHLAGYCGDSNSTNAVFSGETNTHWGGGEFSFACPVGSYIYRIDGRSGKYIDALKFYCRAPGQTIDLEPGINYCPEEPAPIQDACGEAVGQFIVRNVVTAHSGSSRRVMITQKVHLESYCNDIILNPPTHEQKTVKWMIDYSTNGTCGLPAMPVWYEGGVWVGNNHPDYSIDGYYTIVKSANASYPHGHIRMNDFLNSHGISFVKGTGETFDPSQLIVCKRPPFTGGGGGGRGGNHQMQQN